MSVLTVTAKGQLTLRRELLHHLGIAPGARLSVSKLPNGRIELKASRPSGEIADVFDLLKRDDMPTLSIGEIAKVASQGWAGKR